MNFLYLKYAIEIAACGSINKAAERLYIGQPNLSRAIKELETSLGVIIFERSSKGMEITPEGEVFLKYAKSILSQVDALENIFQKNAAHKRHFSISAPCADYVSVAFADFSKQLVLEDKVEACYKETNSANTIKNILQDEYMLGIIRYPESSDKYYKEMMEDKGLSYELITEFKYMLLMSEDCPLAELENVTLEDLEDYIEVVNSDSAAPPSQPNEAKKELPDVGRQIFVYERGNQLELLDSNPDTFMWTSPMSEGTLERYGLIQRPCDGNQRVYKDVMIHRDGYKLTTLDSAFIAELCRVKREIFK